MEREAQEGCHENCRLQHRCRTVSARMQQLQCGSPAELEARARRLRSWELPRCANPFCTHAQLACGDAAVGMATSLLSLAKRKTAQGSFCEMAAQKCRWGSGAHIVKACADGGDPGHDGSNCLPYGGLTPGRLFLGTERTPFWTHNWDVFQRAYRAACAEGAAPHKCGPSTPWKAESVEGGRTQTLREFYLRLYRAYYTELGGQDPCAAANLERSGAKREWCLRNQGTRYFAAANLHAGNSSSAGASQWAGQAEGVAALLQLGSADAGTDSRWSDAQLSDYGLEPADVVLDAAPKPAPRRASQPPNATALALERETATADAAAKDGAACSRTLLDVVKTCASLGDSTSKSCAAAFLRCPHSAQVAAHQLTQAAAERMAPILAAGAASAQPAQPRPNPPLGPRQRVETCARLAPAEQRCSFDLNTEALLCMHRELERKPAPAPAGQKAQGQCMQARIETCRNLLTRMKGKLRDACSQCDAGTGCTEEEARELFLSDGGQKLSTAVPAKEKLPKLCEKVSQAEALCTSVVCSLGPWACSYSCPSSMLVFISREHAACWCPPPSWVSILRPPCHRTGM